MREPQYWDQIYTRKEPEEVSWYQATPRASLALVEEAALPFTAAILDVGDGTSKLARYLVDAGYRDVNGRRHLANRARSSTRPFR